jgi:VacB/RNase II family 3'-5' exoribonuclease
MSTYHQNHRAILENIAHRAMLERGLLPEFSAAALVETGQLRVPTYTAETSGDGEIRDMREYLWSSIDNDDSQDLDQLTVAETQPLDKIKIFVAIADVDVCVKKGSAIDQHASNNTTSVYTVAEIFPMLPQKISTDITSLKHKEDRPSIVVEMLIRPDGTLEGSRIYKAWVNNHAKLAYNSLAAWLEKDGAIPEAVAAVKGLAENIQFQNTASQRIKNLRHINGALSLETIEAKPIFDGDQIRALDIEEKNRAKELIEDFMIAANGVTARYLASKGFPTIRRVVRAPKCWLRIIEIAADHKYKLPETPNSKALEEFLVHQKAADPLRFSDLSLAVIKLLGAGEYTAELPDKGPLGHFGLAVKDYSHSTAPNRRYPDLVTQRLLKAALDGKPVPYSMDELWGLATHCTQAEDAANKVERQVGKSAAALLLETRIWEHFDALVTGASEKGTWVRLLSVPVEGKLEYGYAGMDVGDSIRVQLIAVNVEKGFIDFKKSGSPHH